MLLKPGMTVLARSLSHRREIEAVLEGRNGCRPEQWLARWKDQRGEHLAIIDPGNLLAAYRALDAGYKIGKQYGRW